MSPNNQWFDMEGKWDTSQKLSEIVMDFMKENNLGKQMLEHKAVDLWQFVIGPTVNRATRRVYMVEGVMHVELNSSVIRHELIMLKGKIMEKINKTVGDDVVKDIIFR